jgi:PAS domain S-box-containing protein
VARSRQRLLETASFPAVASEHGLARPTSERRFALPGCEAARARGEDPELLIERSRLGLWLIIASSALFAVTDVRLAGAVIADAYVLKGLQIGAALLALHWLQRLRSRAAVLALMLAVAAVTCALLAVSGAVTGDLVSTMILCLALAWGTATLLPIRVATQCAVVLAAAFAMLLNLALLPAGLGELTGALAYPALAVAIALGASICLAHELERHRAALARESGDRAQAERELRRAYDLLDGRVRERTAELEAANARLEAAGETLRASEHRVRMISKLSSDYAYCVRIEPDLSSVLEWATGASFTRVTGFTPEEIVERGGGLNLIHPDDSSIAWKRLETLLSGRPDVSEFRIFVKDGSIRWIREHGYPEWDAAQARVVRLYAAAQDVTARRRIERTLQEQERFVSAVLDTVGALVAVTDDQGRIVRLNRACEQTFGHTDAEVRGRFFWKLLPEDVDAAQAHTIFDRLLADQRSATYDTHWLTRSGERRRLAWSTSFLRDELGRIQFVIGTGIDVTERERAQEAVRQSEEHWRALIEHSSDLIGILDADATLRYVSASIEPLLGFGAGEWLGCPALELVHPDDAAAVTSGLQAVLEHRDAGNPVVFRARRRDGSWRVFEGIATNLLGVKAVDGIVVNLRDVTERRAAEDALASLNRDLEGRVRDRTTQLEAANRELESFCYSVSHDLRAPLRHLKGFARILAEDCGAFLEASGRHHLERLLRSAQQMEDLIEALLTLSRIGRADIQATAVDLSEMANEILDELRRSQPERAVDAAIAPGIVARGDRRLLRVVLENLLGNAWKYTGQHPRARIEFDVREQDASPVYFVRDDGAGFDMAYADRLFAPFQRLHPRERFEGTGIGLATVQRIVHRHGGRIWPEASVEGGATFHFTLPQS